MSPVPPGRLSRDAVRRAMRLSVLDGALWALMVGFGEAYFLADAVRLGATRWEQGLVVSLPLFMGGLGAVLGVRLLASATHRKRIVLASTLSQVLLLGGLAVLHEADLVTPPLLILLSCLHQVAGQTAGLAWSSWMGDLVPAAVRGRYFGRRSRVVYGATLLGLVGSGLLLQVLEPGAAGDVIAGAGGRGFAVILTVATLARLGSTLLLAFTPEPRFAGLAPPRPVRRVLASPRGRVAWRLLGAAAGLQLVTYIAAPYFAPYMLGELRLSYAMFTAANVVLILLKILTLPAWGHAVDRYGARSVLLLAVLLVALVPLPWIWAQSFLVILVAQAMSGFAWSGHEIAYFTLLLEVTRKRSRPYVFAAQSVLNGGAQIVGTLIGAALLVLLGRSFRTLFLVSAVARLALGLALPRLVPATRPGAGLPRGELLLRVMGVRPHGGMVHRPVLVPGADDGEGAPATTRPA